MQLDLSENSLPVYSALASPVRLQILRLLSEGGLNITQLAEQLHLSKAIVTKHVAQLEAAKLIETQKQPGRSGIQKISHLAVDTIGITFPARIYRSYQAHTCEIKIGHFSGFEVTPTCGLATVQQPVGEFDTPVSFALPDRVDASLLWFSTGYIDYKVPCYLTAEQEPKLLEISFEVASEFPFSNNIWPSDMTFSINGVEIGTWTCPGNFSDVRGFYTPDWWVDGLSQYGLLKHLRVDPAHTNIDGLVLSLVKLDDLKLMESPFIDFRITIDPKAEHPGGVTLFGKGFGNHLQDIIVKLYYVDKT